jgi:hypothetical protein
MTPVVPDEAVRFGREVAARLQSLLKDDFIGAYFVGSIALDGYVRGESDIDIVAVSENRVLDDLKPSVVDALLDAARDCPTRGLEFTLYRREVAASPPERADFEVNVNGGPRMPSMVHLQSSEEPWFWYVLDRAIAHRCGVAISGPPARHLFADAPRRTLLDAMVASMRWHREHEKATLYSVLNASRAWRFAAEGVLGSKLEGAAWARERWRRPALIDAAVQLRHGQHAELDAHEVDEFLDHVEATLASTS